jgi:DNA polymerase-3 subunit epsilon
MLALHAMDREQANRHRHVCIPDEKAAGVIRLHGMETDSQQREKPIRGGRTMSTETDAIFDLVDCRPIVFLDVESTGVSTEDDRIVEITLTRFEVHDEPRVPTVITHRIHPEMRIPAEATEVHGITDLGVADAPKFAELADELLEQLLGVDFGGFNIVGFDLPMLEAEFKRCGIAFDWTQARIIDGYAIMCQQEPRTLEGALMFYCGELLEGAHRTIADVSASIAIVAAQAERYGIEDPDELDAAGRRPEWADRTGKIRIGADGELVFGFGKHAGKPLAHDLEYCEWIMRKDFPSDTKAIVSEVLADRHPGRLSD